MKKITLAFFTFLAFQFGNAQDTCLTASPISAGTTTVAAITGTAPTIICDGEDEATLGAWYSYTPSINGVVNVSSDLPANADKDTNLAVYSGTCGALVCEASSDDVDLFGGNYLSDVTFIVNSGETYYIAWDDRWEADGFDFTLTETEVICTPSPYSLPYSEDFSNIYEVPVCWNLIDDDGDGFNWEVVDYDLDEDGNADGNPTLASYSYDNDSGTALNPDNWVITEAIDLTNASPDSPILTWKARGLDADFADENYTVYVASGNEISDFLASSVIFNEVIGQTGGAGENFTDRSLDISAFAGQLIYIAFRHHDVSDQFVLNIDDLSVTATLGMDEYDTNAFQYFYNKNTDILSLNSSNLSFDSISIFNLLGQQVISKQLSQIEEEINLSNIPDGIYSVNVKIEGQTKTIKLLKH